MRNRTRGMIGPMEMALVVLLIAAIGFVGWRVMQDKDEAADTVEMSEEAEATSEGEGLELYTIENEGLSFYYNSEISTVESSIDTQVGGLYIVSTEIITGLATIHITTGVDGIGGGPQCYIQERDTCKVLSTKEGYYLGAPITYRLVEAKQVADCGYEGAPACDEAPLTTSYFLDAYDGDDASIFGPCCGLVSSKARNLGGKAEIAGSVLVSIQIAEEIRNDSMFENTDVLESIKIIDSLGYRP